MQLGEKAARKWVDYSDESEEQPNSDEDRPTRPTNLAQHPSASTNAPVDHRSEQFIQQQLVRYERARQNSQEIWLLVESDDQPLLDRKMRDIKQNGNKDVINIYMSRDIKGAWDIKLREEAVASWIKDGIDHRKNIKITVGDRNFKNRERGDRPRDRGDRGERGDRGDRRGRDRGQRGGRRGGGRDRGDRDGRRNRDGNTEPQKKKVYVDKATGQAPTNKQECEQKVLQEKERHYTRQEAERVGAGLGNFRNKPKVQVKAETPPESNSKIEKYEPRNERPKEDAKPWTRKDRQELKQDKEKKESQPEMKQRKGETQQVKEKRPDVQQIREKKIQYRENVQQVREKKTQYREKLPSDPINNQQTKTSEPLPDKKKPKRHYVRIDNLTEEQKEKLKQKQPPPAREPEREKFKQKEKDFLSEDSN